MILIVATILVIILALGIGIVYLLKLSKNDGRLLKSNGNFVGKDFLIINKIGQGSFSDVYKCDYLTKNIQIALKCSKFPKKYSECANDEVQAMKAFQDHDPENKFFVKFYENFIYKRHVCIVTQLFGDDLYSYLKKREYKPYSISTIRKLIFKISLQLRIIHQSGYIHTDIKLENILLPPNFDLDEADENIDKINQIDARLIDFGSVVSSDKWYDYVATTRMYRAPEIIMGLRFGLPCDIWSLGVVIVELVTSEIMFDSKDPVNHLFLIQNLIEPFPDWMCKQCNNEQISSMIYPSLNLIKPNEDWSDYSDMKKLSETLQFDNELADLVLKMLKPDPFKRITIEEVIDHPFFDKCRYIFD